MAFEPGYAYLLAAEAFLFFQTCRSGEREALSGAFQHLADHPFLGGEYQETRRDGRNVEVLLRGHFQFSFWTDHAAKEVRILRIDRA